MAIPFRAQDAAANRSWFLIALAFVTSRIFLLSFPSVASDVGIYADYAREQAEAGRAGVSFYAYHARLKEQEPEEYRNVEYPPVALAFLRLPALGMMPANAGDFSEEEFKKSYAFPYRALLALLDVGLFVLLIGRINRFFPDESGGEHRRRLWGYVLSTTILWHLLYDRLDLVLALPVLLAVVLLVSRVHFGWSFGVLALAVHFKLVPLVLAPVFLAGSLPADEALARSKVRLAAALAARAAYLALFLAVLLLPFYVVHGNQCFGFLAYHQARGVEFESLYGSLLLLLQKWTGPVEVVYQFKSVTLLSALAPPLTRIAPWVAVGLLAAAAVVLLVHFVSLLARSPRARDEAFTLAQRHPQLVAGYALLLMMVFIATSKVFSPQYLLWLVPLVVLVPLGGRGGRIFVWAFLLTCVLSTVAFPFLLLSDMVGGDFSGLPVSQWKFIPPSARMAAVLVLRNALFAVLTADLAGHLLCRLRADQATSFASPQHALNRARSVSDG